MHLNLQLQGSDTAALKQPAASPDVQGQRDTLVCPFVFPATALAWPFSLLPQAETSSISSLERWPVSKLHCSLHLLGTEPEARETTRNKATRTTDMYSSWHAWTPRHTHSAALRAHQQMHNVAAISRNTLCLCYICSTRVQAHLL